MRTRKRILIATLAAGLIAALPGTALGQDRTESDVKVTDRVVDRPTVSLIDPPSERPSNRLPDKPADRPTDRPTDRCIQSLTDRRCVDDKPSDRPVDRCLADADHPRRCVDDHRPHDINIRQLIWRLIKAHEWEKLVRLLHWLGWL